MPHGSGSAGGGGYGGGYYGGGYYGGGYHRGSCRYGRRRGSPFSWFIAIICMVAVGAILSLTIPLSLSTERNTISQYTHQYALTDNLIFPFKGDFCQDLRATSRNVPNNIPSTATLSFLSGRPALTDRESFSLSDSVDYNSDYTNYHSWNYVLNAGSNASLKVCYLGDEETRYDVIFYLFRGVSNFRRWVRNVDQTSRAIRSSRLNTRCWSYTYNVTVDANYYFVFYLNSNRPTSLNVTLNFDRTLYSLSSDLILHNCSFPLDGESSCSIDIPISSGWTTFFSTDTTPPVNYNDEVQIYFSCAPRGWLYAVIVLVVLFVFAVVIVSVVLICVKKFKQCSNTRTTPGTTDALNTSSKLASETNFGTPTTSAYPKQFGTSPNDPPPPYDY